LKDSGLVEVSDDGISLTAAGQSLMRELSDRPSLQL
jgi:ribosomal protein S19E (S16A)